MPAIALVLADPCQAFDTINHELGLLLAKLNHLGIGVCVLEIFDSYIRLRQQIISS